MTLSQKAISPEHRFTFRFHSNTQTVLTKKCSYNVLTSIPFILPTNNAKLQIKITHYKSKLQTKPLHDCLGVCICVHKNEHKINEHFRKYARHFSYSLRGTNKLALFIQLSWFASFIIHFILLTEALTQNCGARGMQRYSRGAMNRSHF